MLMEGLIRVSSFCNNNCSVCEDFDFKCKQNKTIAQIMEDVHKCPEVILPCNADNRKDFSEIVTNIKNQGKKLTIHTNGRLMHYGNIRNTYSKADVIIYHDFGKFQELITKVPLHNFKDRGLQVRRFSWGAETHNISMPTEIVIEITGRCNFDCGNCFNKLSFPSGRQDDHLPKSYIKQVIDGIAAAGLQKVRFSGGEPLLRDDLFELMHYAKGKGLEIWLNTNAQLIDADIAQKLSRYVSNVLIAFNGYDDDSEKQWTGVAGSLSKKITAVKLLKRAGVSEVRTGSVTTQDNIENLEKIFNLVNNSGIDSWEVWRPVPVIVQEPINIKSLCRKLVKLSLNFGKPIKIVNAIPFCSVQPEKILPVASGAIFDDGHSRMVVDPRGYMKPSYFDSTNIGDARNVLECWSSQYLRKIHNMLDVHPACKSCMYLDSCKGGLHHAYCASPDKLDPLVDKSIFAQIGSSLETPKH